MAFAGMPFPGVEPNYDDWREWMPSGWDAAWRQPAPVASHHPAFGDPAATQEQIRAREMAARFQNFQGLNPTVRHVLGRLAGTLAPDVLNEAMDRASNTQNAEAYDAAQMGRVRGPGGNVYTPTVTPASIDPAITLSQNPILSRHLPTMMGGDDGRRVMDERLGTGFTGAQVPMPPGARSLQGGGGGAPAPASTSTLDTLLTGAGLTHIPGATMGAVDGRQMLVPEAGQGPTFRAWQTALQGAGLIPAGTGPITADDFGRAAGALDAEGRKRAAAATQRELELYNARYVQPATIRAQGTRDAARIRAEAVGQRGVQGPDRAAVRESGRNYSGYRADYQRADGMAQEALRSTPPTAEGDYFVEVGQGNHKVRVTIPAGVAPTPDAIRDAILHQWGRPEGGLMRPDDYRSWQGVQYDPATEGALGGTAPPPPGNPAPGNAPSLPPAFRTQLDGIRAAGPDAIAEAKRRIAGSDATAEEKAAANAYLDGK